MVCFTQIIDYRRLLATMIGHLSLFITSLAPGLEPSDSDGPGCRKQVDDFWACFCVFIRNRRSTAFQKNALIVKHKLRGVRSEAPGSSEQYTGPERLLSAVRSQYTHNLVVWP